MHHSRGGKHAEDNYMPACSVCNRLRWYWASKEIRRILRLGIYAASEIREKTQLGKALQSLYRRRPR